MAFLEITDGSGRRWQIWDTYPQVSKGRGVVREGFAGGWLTFETEHEKRRLAPVPAGWETRSTAELLLLLEESEPARRATPE
jgi:hypothetical protein